MGAPELCRPGVILANGEPWILAYKGLGDLVRKAKILDSREAAANYLAFRQKTKESFLSAEKRFFSEDTIYRMTHDFARLCPLGSRAHLRCFEGTPAIHEFEFLPKWPPLLPEDVESKYFDDDNPGFVNLDSSFIGDLTWLPVDLALSGSDAVNRWQKLAETGSPFGCREDFCDVVVSGVTNSKEETLIVCRTQSSSSSEVGAPDRCKQVVIFANDKTWILAVGAEWSGSLIHAEAVGYAVGEPDFELVVASRHPVLSSTLLSAARTALAVPPFSLSVQDSTLLPSSAVIGTAKYRNSSILKGWREIVTVRLDVTQENNEAHFIASMTIYLNKQNTPNVEEYSGPNALQQEKYLKALRKQLMTELGGSLCPVPASCDSHFNSGR